MKLGKILEMLERCSAHSADLIVREVQHLESLQVGREIFQLLQPIMREIKYPQVFQPFQPLLRQEIELVHAQIQGQ